MAEAGTGLDVTVGATPDAAAAVTRTAVATARTPTRPAAAAARAPDATPATPPVVDEEEERIRQEFKRKLNLFWTPVAPRVFQAVAGVQYEAYFPPAPEAGKPAPDLTARPKLDLAKFMEDAPAPAGSPPPGPDQPPRHQLNADGRAYARKVFTEQVVPLMGGRIINHEWAQTYLQQTWDMRVGGADGEAYRLIVDEIRNLAAQSNEFYNVFADENKITDTDRMGMALELLNTMGQTAEMRSRGEVPNLKRLVRRKPDKNGEVLTKKGKRTAQDLERTLRIRTLLMTAHDTIAIIDLAKKQITDMPTFDDDEPSAQALIAVLDRVRAEVAPPVEAVDRANAVWKPGEIAGGQKVEEQIFSAIVSHGATPGNELRHCIVIMGSTDPAAPPHYALSTTRGEELSTQLYEAFQAEYIPNPGRAYNFRVDLRKAYMLAGAMENEQDQIACRLLIARVREKLDHDYHYPRPQTQREQEIEGDEQAARFEAAVQTAVAPPRPEPPPTPPPVEPPKPPDAAPPTDDDAAALEREMNALHSRIAGRASTEGGFGAYFNFSETPGGGLVITPEGIRAAEDLYAQMEAEAGGDPARLARLEQVLLEARNHQGTGAAFIGRDNVIDHMYMLHLQKHHPEALPPQPQPGPEATPPPEPESAPEPATPPPQPLEPAGLAPPGAEPPTPEPPAIPEDLLREANSVLSTLSGRAIHFDRGYQTFWQQPENGGLEVVISPAGRQFAEEMYAPLEAAAGGDAARLERLGQVLAVARQNQESMTKPLLVGRDIVVDRMYELHVERHGAPAGPPPEAAPATTAAPPEPRPVTPTYARTTLTNLATGAFGGLRRLLGR